MGLVDVQVLVAFGAVVFDHHLAGGPIGDLDVEDQVNGVEDELAGMIAGKILAEFVVALDRAAQVDEFIDVRAAALLLDLAGDLFLDHRFVPGLLFCGGGLAGGRLGLDVFLHLPQALAELLVLLHQLLHLLLELVDLALGGSGNSGQGLQQAEGACRCQGKAAFQCLGHVGVLVGDVIKSKLVIQSACLIQDW